MKIEAGTPHTLVPEKPQNPHTKGVHGNQASLKVEDEAFSVTLSEDLKPSPLPARDEEALRRAKVAAIRDQLASGSYNISGKDVANKILDVLKD